MLTFNVSSLFIAQKPLVSHGIHAFLQSHTGLAAAVIVSTELLHAEFSNETIA